LSPPDTMHTQICTLTNTCEVTVNPEEASCLQDCGVAIVDDATVAHLLLKDESKTMLDPAMEIAKLQKKVGPPPSSVPFKVLGRVAF